MNKNTDNFNVFHYHPKQDERLANDLQILIPL